ncbi:hypothetical protein RP300_00042 [Oligella urethralis]|uniref:CRISPR-associated helicase Cas3' n=1 Tax=Oligella urethralis TaxID=90245 RepID=UPI002958D791|nr:CRISPR-associated helicase Cas3' [Oligella urethralis]WOS36513.1 hypothetical protein RP300_00042 [Oligella urethralis]
MVLRPRSNISVPTIKYEDCPAKTYQDSEGFFRLGRSVYNHCLIVGEVAKELIRRSAVAHLFPQGSAFTAATHDIGKVSPTFYNKLYSACALTLLPGANPAMEKNWGGHAGVSQLTAKELGAPNYIPEILGQHHGFLPNVSGRRAIDGQFGGEPWQREREDLVLALNQALNEGWPEVEHFATARLLAGLTCVADWIGSSQYFDNPNVKWQPLIKQALDDAGFVQPEYRQGLSFTDVFGFNPREAQRLLYEQVKDAGVYVLEAPMGLGKTEAALYAAYQVLAQGKASGIYFALPTQLTSNKMFERFNIYLEQILDPNCQHRSLLLHANAWLFETEMGEEGRPGGAWFNQAKRGLLAPFAVGTIDQALMAAMNVKHGFVRAYGLAGKVVILDEVHTYDAYTNVLLKALIRLLRQLDCTVIILSATLSQERRRVLIDCEARSSNYPLITALPKGDSSIIEIPVAVTQSQQVAVVIQNNDEMAIEEALLRAEQGQQVLWIENTVREAQERYLLISARAQSIGVDCGLLHSRYRVKDRQAIEKKWVDLFGKIGSKSGLRNQEGRILVGTQVLEQSLDIDADFLVTRFAPTDMLLQRFGRLWRHADTQRVYATQCEAWLLCPPLTLAIENPKSVFGSTAYVYAPYILCRSLEVWQDLEQVVLPNDIRRLVEQTYEAREETDHMAEWLHELKEGSRDRLGQNALEQLAQIGLAQAGNTMPESRAQTRYSQVDNLDVLLLRDIVYNKDTKEGVLTLLDGEKVYLPLNRSALSRKDWRERTKILMQEIVSVSPNNAPARVSYERLKGLGLQHCFYLGDPFWPDEESLFRLALVDETEQLRGLDNQKVHDKYEIEYRTDLGYRVIK